MIENNTDGIVFSSEERRVLGEALRVYQKGDYELALDKFDALQNGNPALLKAIRYYRKFCLNVVGTKPSENDKMCKQARATMKWLRWLALPGVYLILPIFKLSDKDGRFGPFSVKDFVSIFLGAVIFVSGYKIYKPFFSGLGTLRCKHCGHYTGYRSPDEGDAYMGTNNCEICGRGYPMPSARWDTDWGQSYIYQRGSVSDPEFYKEFEQENPDCQKSEAADHYLRKTFEEKPETLQDCGENSK
ncbi:MAG: hypothetical protein WC530_00470 [Candidatus Omnitrophota bacterium]|jgi:hypothetical protein